MTGPVQTQPVTDPGSVTIPVPPAPQPTPTQTFTQADINAAVEAARQQEQDKFYPQLKGLTEAQKEADKRIKAFDSDLAERTAAQKAAEDAAAAEAEKTRQAELTYEQKFNETRTGLESQIEQLRREAAERDAVLAKERVFNELSEYRRGKIAENEENLLPHLRPFVQGNTTQEIDESVSAFVETSNAILSEMANATQQQLAGSRGVGVTAPPVGPMDTDSGHQTFSPADIAGMSMQEYAKHRAGLLGAAGQQPSQGRGMLG